MENATALAKFALTYSSITTNNDACVPYSYKGNIFVAEVSRPEILQTGWGSARCPQHC